jgi:hypothetical protein
VRYDPTSRTLYVRNTASGKNKSEPIDIPEDPVEMYRVLLRTFREKLGIFSSLDLQVRKEEQILLLSHRRSEVECEWKKLRPRSLKDLMIINYVSKIKEEKNLTEKEARELLFMIQLSFQLKKIGPEDVVYSNRAIHKIQGLEYDSKRGWYIDRECGSISTKTEKSHTSQRFYQSLDTFIRNYKNQRLKME